MNYTIDDLKEGRIIVFDNGTEYYGIISKDIPNNENIKLACVYEQGGWDKLENILECKFSLYESEYPIYSFVNLIESRDINFCKRCKCLKEVQKSVSFMEAIKAYKKGKSIYCIMDGEKIVYSPMGNNNNYAFTMIDGDGDGLSPKEILNGKWYIQDDEN